MARRLSVLDMDRCVGCQSCMFACARRLGQGGLAWDDIYYDDLFNQGAAAFTDRQVTEEILKHPPMAKKPGMFDYMTERGLVELNPNSLPEDLHEGFDLLTDEMTTYNYKANYEQQLQIEKLQAILDKDLQAFNSLCRELKIPAIMLKK